MAHRKSENKAEYAARKRFERAARLAADPVGERAKLAEQMRAWREKNRERHKLYMREYSRKNRERIRAHDRKQTAKRRANGTLRADRLRSKYGITIADFDAMKAAQGGLCAICEKAPTRKNPWGAEPNLYVDHDHRTGKVRGLLCSACNTAVGQMHDSTIILRKAIAYLEAHADRGHLRAG